jgi:hypothetical protein
MGLLQLMLRRRLVQTLDEKGKARQIFQNSRVKFSASAFVENGYSRPREPIDLSSPPFLVGKITRQISP